MNTTLTSLDPIPAVPPAATPAHRPQPVARFDAARTTPDNQRHWSGADGLSASAANSAEVRRVLRNRSRYEDGNNSYVCGLTGDRANETVGTGPRLQLTLPDAVTDPDFQVEQPVRPDLARAVEEKWSGWCKAVGLLDKLLVMDESETREGEVFGFKLVNPEVRDGVQLDLRLYEADQVDTPDFDDVDERSVPGIVFDQHGNPVEYHVLKRHPGDGLGPFGRTGAEEYDRIPARQMIHWFRPRRAGQARGLPANTCSLPLYAILRRLTLASLLTAEAQSRINVAIEQENAAPDYSGVGDGTDPDDGAGEQIQFAGTHALVLGAGQSAKTLTPTAPGPAYGSFKAEILTESGRAINAPGNVSRGTSAEMNYSSGRLDMQQWQRSIRIRRRRLEVVVLDVLFREWSLMAAITPGYLPVGLPAFSEWRWKWRWDAFVSIDPVKDATAATERLTNGTSTLDRECGDLGEDWEEVQDQRLAEEAREIRRRAELGLGPKTPAASPAPVAAPVDGGDPADA